MCSNQVFEERLIYCKDDLYYLCVSNSNINISSSSFTSESVDSSKNKFKMKSYAKMGHLNFKDLLECSNKSIIRGLNIAKESKKINCEVWALDKLTRTPLPDAQNA